MKKQHWFGLSLLLTGLMCVILPSATLLISGCDNTKKASEPDVTAIVPETVPQTHFDPAATIPSVLPSIATVTAQAHAAQTQQAAVVTQANSLTAGNADTVKPSLLQSLNWLGAKLQGVVDDLFAARSAASANDQAATALTAQVQDARSIVRDREDQLKSQAEIHAKALNELNARHAAEMANEKAANAKIIAQKDQEIAREGSVLTKIIFGGTVGLGLLAAIGGGLLIFLVTPRTAGIVCSGGGIMTVCLGMAGLYYGREIALAGCVIGGIDIILSIWLAIHYLRQDSASLAKQLAPIVAAVPAAPDGSATPVAGAPSPLDSPWNIRQIRIMMLTPGARKMLAAVTALAA